MKKRILSILTVLVLCLALMPMAVFADDTDKTLTVGANQTYTTIQAAIDHISDQEDKNGWTITVETGSYTYFTVNQYISNLTITGESDATVDISTGSIQLMGDTITLEGLTFTATDTAWSVPVIKDASSDAGIFYDSMVTIKNCAFEGTNAGCAIWICRLNATVQNCTFDGFSYALEIINETSTKAKIDTETTTGTITISGNTVTDCDFFIHYGVRSGITFIVTNNDVTGSEEEVCASLFAWEGDSITVTGNTFTYCAFGLQNAINGVTAKDFLDTNTFINSYAVDDYYNYSTGKDYSVTYYAPEISGKTPVWSVSETGVSGTMAEYFAAALAGHENDNPLTFTTTNGEGDLVCMGLAYQALNLTYAIEKTSEPGLEKVIIQEDDTEVKKDDIAANGSVTFQLTSNVPSTLDEYIDYESTKDSTTTDVNVNIPSPLKEGATYTLTFHDMLDSALTYNAQDVTVTLVTYTQTTDKETGETTTTQKGSDIITDYAEINANITDGCTLEVAIDLLTLYSNGLIVESDFGTAQIVVTYTATFKSDEVAPGAYYNTAWVVYPDGQSEEDKVEVDTYGIRIYKIDNSLASPADATASDASVRLGGAVFNVYTDISLSESSLLTTLTTQESGNDKGIAILNGLAEGTYYLEEESAPEGYVYSNTVITVTIPADADSTTYIASIGVGNAPIPSTGGAGTRMYLIGGACLIAVAGTVFIVSRRKKED